MSKTTRADWAASAPWSGITNKPAIGGVTDIGQLTGKGFANRQVPVWNVAQKKFIPANISGIAGYSPSPSPSPSPSSGFIDYFVDWDVPLLAPLQSAYEDFPAIGASLNQPIVVGPSNNVTFFIFLAFVPSNDTIRLQVTNMNSTPEDLVDSHWRLRLFDI